MELHCPNTLGYRPPRSGTQTIKQPERIASNTIEPLEARSLFSTSISPLDLSFGNGTGIVNTSLRVDAEISGAVKDDQGRLIVCGYTSATGFGINRDILLARFNPDGSLDPTFGSFGIARTDIGGDDDEAAALALLPDGTIVVVGTTTLLMRPTAMRSDPVVLHYFANGARDFSFGSTNPAMFGRSTVGVAYIGIAGAFSFNTGSAIGVLPDGRIVIAGNANPQSDSANADPDETRMFVATLTSDGTIEVFHDGQTGYALVDPILASKLEVATDLAVETDGGVLVAGYNHIGSHLVATVSRMQFSGLTGDPPRPFAQSQRLTGDFSSAFAIALQDDGKILLTGAEGRGHSRSSLSASVTVSRYGKGLNFDETFGSHSLTKTKLDRVSGGIDVAALSDGSVLVASGTGRNAGVLENNQYDTFIMRYSANGKLDRRFGKHGKLKLDFPLPRTWPDDDLNSPGRLVLNTNADGSATVIGASGGFVHFARLLPPPLPGIDLFAGGLSGGVPSGSAAGAKAKLFKLTVANVGGGDLNGAIPLRLIASVDSSFDPNVDMPFADLSVKAKLKSMTSTHVNLKFKFPSNLSPGTYYLFAQVDASNLFAEHDETNNVSTAWAYFTI